MKINEALCQHDEWLARMKKLTAWPPVVAAVAKRVKREREQLAALVAAATPKAFR